MKAKINIEGFKKILRASQKDLLKFYTDGFIQKYGKENVISTKDYVFLKGKNPILLVAHLDTVHKEKPELIVFDKEQGMVSVGTFTSKDAALKYYYHMIGDSYVMGIIKNQPGAEVMIISSENYPIFYQDKNVTNYKIFFERNYL